MTGRTVVREPFVDFSSNSYHVCEILFVLLEQQLIQVHRPTLELALIECCFDIIDDRLDVLGLAQSSGPAIHKYVVLSPVVLTKPQRAGSSVIRDGFGAKYKGVRSVLPVLHESAAVWRNCLARESVGAWSSRFLNGAVFYKSWRWCRNSTAGE